MTLRLITTNPQLALNLMILAGILIGVIIGAGGMFLYRTIHIRKYSDVVTNGQVSSLREKVYGLEKELMREKQERQRLDAFRRAILSLSNDTGEKL